MLDEVEGHVISLLTPPPNYFVLTNTTAIVLNLKLDTNAMTSEEKKVVLFGISV